MIASVNNYIIYFMATYVILRTVSLGSSFVISTLPCLTLLPSNSSSSRPAITESFGSAIIVKYAPFLHSYRRLYFLWLRNGLK